MLRRADLAILIVAPRSPAALILRKTAQVAFGP
jgi:hypothetical protein